MLSDDNRKKCFESAKMTAMYPETYENIINNK